MRQFHHGRMEVRVFETAREMAGHAAASVAACMRGLLDLKPEITVIFSGAESQQAFHRSLADERDLDWSRVRAFAVDDFWSPGLPLECTVAAQPQRDLYDFVRPGTVHAIDSQSPSPETERARYESLIANHPADIACLGIGVSGHIALNEPEPEVFRHSERVRVVSIHADSIRQLRVDPNFRDAPEIPQTGITITIPELIRCPNIFVIVPYAIKAEIVARMLASEVTWKIPASILREHDNAVMYLDGESSGGVRGPAR